MCGRPIHAGVASTVRTYWGFHTSIPWYVTWDGFCGPQALIRVGFAPRHDGWRTKTTVLFCPAYCRCSMFKIVSILRSVSNLRTYFRLHFHCVRVADKIFTSLGLTFVLSVFHKKQTKGERKPSNTKTGLRKQTHGLFYSRDIHYAYGPYERMGTLLRLYVPKKMLFTFVFVRNAAR